MTFTSQDGGIPTHGNTERPMRVHSRAGWAEPDALAPAPSAHGSPRRTAPTRRARVAPPPLSRNAFFHAGWAEPDARASAPPAHSFSPQDGPGPTRARVAHPPSRARCFSTQDGPGPTRARAGPACAWFSSRNGLGPARRARAAPSLAHCVFPSRMGLARRARAGPAHAWVLCDGRPRPDARASPPPISRMVSLPRSEGPPTHCNVSHAGWTRPDARTSAPPAHGFSA